MRKYIILLCCALGVFKLHAQQSNPVLPDSIGKYLFELFINRADISQPETKLRDVGITPEITFIYHPDIYWPCLLEQADKYDFNPQNTTYYKTFFDSHICSKEKKVTCPFNLRIAMKKQASDSVFVFQASALWSNNIWTIQEIEPYLCYHNEYAYNDFGFPPLSEGDPCFEEGAPYPYNKGFHAVTDLKNPIVLPSILDFSDKVYNLIKNETAYGTDELFLTKEEYLKAMSWMQDMIKEILKTEDLNEDERREAQEIYDNPSILYEQELLQSWEMLPKNMKEEFKCNDIKELSLNETTCEIKNWNYKDRSGQIEATINTEFEYNSIRAGIYYTATLYDSKWKLIHIQSFPYSIMETQSLGFDTTERGPEAFEIIEEVVE